MSFGKILFSILLFIIFTLGLSIAFYFYFRSREKYASDCKYKVSDCAGQCQSSSTITGVWSSIIGCGQDTFDLISMGSALPQDYDKEDDFFSLHIQGTYDPTLSAKKSKYLISIGGSMATSDGWTSFLKSASEDINNFYNQCKTRGIVGIDLDIEEFSDSDLGNVVTLCKGLRAIDASFLIMYTILLGMPSWFAPLLTDSTLYDYLTLMLYDGGMYEATGTGAGCDWDGWAELFLSQGQKGCETPLLEDRETYAKTANLSSVDPSKVLLGVIVDTTGQRFDPTMMQTANQLISDYGAAGIMIWVVPGWATQDSIEKIQNLGFPIDPQSCVVSDTCPVPQKPCDGTCACKATACGKQKQTVTDEYCQPCPGQTTWPCDQQGFCECPVNDLRDLRRFIRNQVQNVNPVCK